MQETVFLSTADLNGDHHPDVVLDLPTGVLTLLNLAGTSPNFSLTVASTTTATVKAGQTASYSLVLSPVGGLNQTVMLACTGVPALSSCSVSPTSLTLDKTTTAIVTVNTTASTAAFLPTSAIDIPKKILNQAWLLLLGFVAVGIVRNTWPLPRRRRRRFGLASAAPIMGLLCFVLILGSCGGGNSGGGGGGTAGTTPGTYTIIISATTNTGSTTLTHTKTLTLVVQ